MVRLAQNEIHFGDYIPLPAVIENIDAVKAGEVQDLAEALFQPRQASLTLLGPVDEKEDLTKLLTL